MAVSRMIQSIQRPQEQNFCTELLPTYRQVNCARFRRCETTRSHCHSNRCGHVAHWPRHHHSPSSRWLSHDRSGPWLLQGHTFPIWPTGHRRIVPDLAYGTSAASELSEARRRFHIWKIYLDHCYRPALRALLWCCEEPSTGHELGATAVSW